MPVSLLCTEAFPLEKIVAVVTVAVIDDADAIKELSEKSPIAAMKSAVRDICRFVAPQRVTSTLPVLGHPSILFSFQRVNPETPRELSWGEST